jgi:hypothetical protein
MTLWISDIGTLYQGKSVMHWHVGDDINIQVYYTLLLQDGLQVLGPLLRLAFRFQTPPQCQPKRQQRLHSVRPGHRK